MLKGINETDPGKIADAGFNECCLLFGLPGRQLKVCAQT